jgi:hypothetical protein
METKITEKRLNDDSIQIEPLLLVALCVLCATLGAFAFFVATQFIKDVFTSAGVL